MRLPLRFFLAALCLASAFLAGPGCVSTAPSTATRPREAAQTAPAALKPLRLACIGDSITFGAGTSNLEFEAYPAQLQRMLGPGWIVGNFGVSGSTLLKQGDRPYQQQPAFERALNSSPDVVVIMLGTNDSKPQNWKYVDRFEADYRDLVAKFKALPGKPRIYVCRPVPVVGEGYYGINHKGVLELIPIIDRIAASEGLGLIDQHASLTGHEAFLPDTIHPNDAGAELMARAVHKALTGADFTGPVPTRSETLWHGYQRLNFKADGRWSLLVRPAKAAPGNPWIWRTEFFNVEPQTDLALLAKGYHVAYTDLRDLYGAPVALDRMDAFHAYLVSEYKLSPASVLEGFSRGGLFALNWAARHPARTAGLYLDAPVCDFKSWPAGRGKGKSSPADWAKLLKAYGMDEAQALAYPLNPIDNLKTLAAAKLPILCVVGDADKTVPVEENTGLLETRYRALGGIIQVIHKPGVDHHPHSLSDPAPIVEFITKLSPDASLTP
jgi:lysophospholipase L1-like esterase/pimeloyl-ACP methyl ester carboxylesterase